MNSNKTVSIIGTGSYVPDKVITNHDLSKIMDTSDEWIFSRTGMKEEEFVHRIKPLLILLQLQQQKSY